MKKTINVQLVRVLGIIAIVAIVGFAFTACEGPEGPMGPAGQNGQPGSVAPGAVEVWDSSPTPKRLGVFVGTVVDEVAWFISTSGYIFRLNWATAETSGDTIYFTGANQTGDPLRIARPINTAFYNPHSGGTWYLYAENAFADPVTGYASYYDSSGNPSTSSSTTTTCYKIRVATPAELGIPEGITPPLVLRVAE